MSEAREHPPGRFCWLELSAPEPEASARFYGALFGWSAVALDGPWRASSLRLRGLEAAALQRADGPARWTLYLSVASAALGAPTRPASCRGPGRAGRSPRPAA